jgi:hypothetical protein
VAAKTKAPRSKAIKKVRATSAAPKTKPPQRSKKATPAPKKAAPAPKKKASAITPLELSQFPAESITRSERWICLACVWQVFTKHMHLAPKTALLEIKRHTPSLQELNAPALARPYFAPDAPKAPCPYCGSASTWHAPMWIYRIESGKATDALRRALVKSFPKTGDQYVVLEQKATQQHAFFEWLEKISETLDLDDPAWLRDASLHYLSRKEPKVDWKAQFERVHSLRRSRRLQEGWEVDGGRLFLAPVLFDELLLVQYLLSRSHRAGGLTLEGRYTLPELWHRLRTAGYLRTVGVQASNPSDALEQLIGYLGGGDASVRFYHIVDRRSYLQTAARMKLAKQKT